MFGKSRHGASYYACQPERNIGQAADERFPGHGSVWIREDDLLAGLSRLPRQAVLRTGEA